MREAKVTCRTPNAEGTTTIPKWKFDLVRRIVLNAINEAGPDGLLFKNAAPFVKSSLSSADLKRLGSVGWHTTCVKLEMEVAGEIARVPGATPQRLVRKRKA